MYLRKMCLITIPSLAENFARQTNKFDLHCPSLDEHVSSVSSKKLSEDNKAFSQQVYM